MSTPPPWLTAGRGFYKAAFEKRTRPGLDASIDDWMHLSPEEHAFINSHLLYLNLLAQADQIALLEDIQTRLAENQTAQEELVDVLLSARAASEGDEPEPDNGFYDDEGLDDDFPDQDDSDFYPEEDFEQEDNVHDFEDNEHEQPTEVPPTNPPLPSDKPPVVIDVLSEVTESNVVSP
jgi:hypothetical protein